MGSGGSREGAGRKKKGKRTQFSMRMAVDTKEKIEGYLDRILSMNELEEKKDDKEKTLLRSVQEFYINRIQTATNNQYTVTNIEFGSSKPNEDITLIIENEKEFFSKKNIKFEDIYTYMNEFIVVKLFDEVSLFKSIGNFKTLDEFQDYLEKSE